MVRQAERGRVADRRPSRRRARPYGALDLYPDEFVTLYNVGCSFARLGERERALEALDRAVGSGRGLRKWFENDADLDTLRGDPRFEVIVSRLQA